VISGIEAPIADHLGVEASITSVVDLPVHVRESEPLLLASTISSFLMIASIAVLTAIHLAF
jgi:hypothetical protein